MLLRLLSDLLAQQSTVSAGQTEYNTADTIIYTALVVVIEVMFWSHMFAHLLVVVMEKDMATIVNFQNTSEMAVNV